MNVWFWQRVATAHMSGLAVALSAIGHQVVYVSGRAMSTARTKLGWTIPEMPGVSTRWIESEDEAFAVAHEAPEGSVHICEGIRANGAVGAAQRALECQGLSQWVMMETVDDAGLLGPAKRAAYRGVFSSRLGALEGVLCIGDRTPEWVVRRGVPSGMAFPFAYFLEEMPLPTASGQMRATPFRLVYVGQFIKRKRVDLLLKALARSSCADFELSLVGGGPQEDALRSLARAIPEARGRVRWIGQLPMDAVRQEVARSDCLILPSRHDGWGAVVSEALLAGTRVVCSDACGSSGVVRASGAGSVFRSGDVLDLCRRIEDMASRGTVHPNERRRIQTWAKCLDATRGANYLDEILSHVYASGPRPVAPWERG